MKLKKLLEIHYQYSGGDSIINNFGDGYLVKRNPIYRNIRIATLKLGYRFSSKLNVDYEAMPLSQIGSIIKDKEIPYTPNVSVLEKMVTKNAFPFTWNDIPNPKANHLLHESAHVVARAITSQNLKRTNMQQKILALLLEESFGNAVELYASIFNKSQIDELFFFQNSFVVSVAPKTAKELKQGVQHLGHQNFFKLLIMAYLHANFLWKDFSHSQFKRSIEYTMGKSWIKDQKVTQLQLKRLKAATSNAFILNERFRTNTNQFYFRLLGYHQSIHQLLNFDYIDLMQADSRFSTCLEQLVTVALDRQSIDEK